MQGSGDAGSQTLYYIGLGIAAALAGFLGYFKKPKEEQEKQAQLVGAVVDNKAIAPLIEHMKQLTDALNKLHAAITLTEKREEDERRTKELMEKRRQEEQIASLLRRLEEAEAKKVYGPRQMD